MAASTDTGPAPAGEALPSDGRGRRSRWYRPALGSKEATHGIYIEIVLLAVIVALEGKRASDRDVVTTVFGALVAVVLAELYAYYIGSMIGTGRRPERTEIGAALRSTAGGLVSVVPPIFVLMLGVVGVIALDTGFTVAKWTGVAIIAGFSFFANRRAGLSTRQSLLAAACFATVGLGLVLLKQYFH